jgi:hypothetical protein
VAPPTVPGVQYRFYPGSTLEPIATSATATVTKVYAGSGRAYAVPSNGGAYLVLAIDVPNGSTLVEISYQLFAPGNLTTHVFLDHYQPGTNNVLPPLVDKDITGAGFESLTVALEQWSTTALMPTPPWCSASAWTSRSPAFESATGRLPTRSRRSTRAGCTTPASLAAKLADGEERTVSMATAIQGGAGVVPPGASAVAVTLTVTETEGSGGYVSAFSA